MTLSIPHPIPHRLTPEATLASLSRITKAEPIPSTPLIPHVESGTRLYGDDWCCVYVPHLPKHRTTHRTTNTPPKGATFIFDLEDHRLIEDYFWAEFQLSSNYAPISFIPNNALRASAQSIFSELPELIKLHTATNRKITREVFQTWNLHYHHLNGNKYDFRRENLLRYNPKRNVYLPDPTDPASGLLIIQTDEIIKSIIKMNPEQIKKAKQELWQIGSNSKRPVNHTRLQLRHLEPHEDPFEAKLGYSFDRSLFEYLGIPKGPKTKRLKHPPTWALYLGGEGVIYYDLA